MLWDFYLRAKFVIIIIISYPMFIEPTITRVHSGFDLWGTYGLIQKLCYNKEAWSEFSLSNLWHLVQCSIFNQGLESDEDPDSDRNELLCDRFERECTNWYADNEIHKWPGTVTTTPIFCSYLTFIECCSHSYECGTLVTMKCRIVNARLWFYYILVEWQKAE